MRRTWLVWSCFFLLWINTVAAQDNPLSASKPNIVNRLDVYGQNALFAQGDILNQSTDKAFDNIELTATAFDSSGSEIGEGFGYPSNACGTALPPDFILAPGAQQAYIIPIELYEDDTTVDHVDITIDSSPTSVLQSTNTELGTGVKQIDRREVVQVEWIDEQNLRYGSGCRRDLFTDWSWRTYDLRTAAVKEEPHPKAELVTQSLRNQLGLLDPLYFQHSFLSFDPHGRRLVYQTELNTVLSAEGDGSFKRRMFEKLSDRTLQGITWLEKGIFLAYYYGASGDLVTYFTANADGRGLSETPANSTPSLIVPGASPDGEDIIIGLQVDGKTGYYDKRAAYETTTLLFESPLPGNNWPGPLYEQDKDGAAFVYAAVPKEDEAVLMCYNALSKKATELTTLPLQLNSEERAWWFFSPDYNTIALAADGTHGGLWLIDLNAVGACD